MNRLTSVFLAVALSTSAVSSLAEEPSVLSAGMGATILPTVSNFAFCVPFGPSAGFGGMPMVISDAIDTQGGYLGDPNALDPSNFVVRVGPNNTAVQPICVTLAPAVDLSERRTILFTGNFGFDDEDAPTGIQIVGDVMTVNGTSLRGLRTKSVSEVNGGPTLVLAEHFDPAAGVISTSSDGDGSNDRYCPQGDTSRVVKLTFSGGVSGPNGGVLMDDDNAMNAILILGVGPDGRRRVVHPFALRDDDFDNHLDACLGADAEGLTLLRASVDSHNFFAPQNVPGKAVAVSIVPGSGQ